MTAICKELKRPETAKKNQRMRSGSVSTSFKECQKTLLRLRKEVGDLETEDVTVVAGAVDLRDMELRTQLEDLGTTLAALLKAVGPGADMDMCVVISFFFLFSFLFFFVLRF